MATYGFSNNIDKVTDVPMVIDYAHHEIHSGSAYNMTHSTLKANAEVMDVYIKTGIVTDQAHMVISIDAALSATFELYENSTMVDASANRLTPFNLNRSSSNTSNLTICHTPTGTETGTRLILHYIGNATQGAVAGTGGNVGTRNEIVLRNNTAYLIRVTSRSNGNTCTAILDWYEHSPKNE
jgi:hypothetical protein